MPVISGSRLLQLIGKLLSGVFRWSPIGRRVVLTIEGSDDPHLNGASLRGTIRAWTPNDGVSSFLIQLDQPIDYQAGSRSADVELLVAMPAVRRHGGNRLRITWIAAVLIDAPSFADRAYDRAIGSGRVRLL